MLCYKFYDIFALFLTNRMPKYSNRSYEPQQAPRFWNSLTYNSASYNLENIASILSLNQIAQLLCNL